VRAPRPPEMLLVLVLVLLMVVAPLPNRTRPAKGLPQPARLARWCRRRAWDLRALLGLHAFFLHAFVDSSRLRFSFSFPIALPPRGPASLVKIFPAARAENIPAAGGVDAERETAGGSRSRSCLGSWPRSWSWLAEGAGVGATEAEMERARTPDAAARPTQHRRRRRARKPPPPKPISRP
ncbi:hypothetical protein B0H13DRAFT_2127872, partial [Mycena leptocephala]